MGKNKRLRSYQTGNTLSVHRSIFSRQTSNNSKGNDVEINRTYIVDKSLFKRKLREFNNLEHGMFLVCVGYVNIEMRACTICYDGLKHLAPKSELYFIDKLEKAQTRTVMCYGCVGALLHESNS